jgi:hypothetical protein
MDYSLQVITEKHSEATRELMEHLDCRDDEKALRLLDEVLEYTSMLVHTLSDWHRARVGK